MRFEFGDHCLDDQLFTITDAAGPVHVEPQVFAVLHHLIVNRDRVVAKEELLDHVWGDRFVSESALTSRVKAARRAVGDSGREQRIIRTVHGRGYQFVADLRTSADQKRSRLMPLRSRPLGRDADIAGLLDRTRRAPLVTIVGTGGVGKTTLALAVAHAMSSEFEDGAVFVDLAPVPPESEVTRAVADAVGIEGDVARAVDDLAEHLANRPVLLVLDNCEHVLGHAAALADRMLEKGRAARILATSRESLHVTGEHVWPLGPLGEAGTAVFVERAHAAEPRVQWEPTDPRVIDLCRRLDNVPLALELAAGQLRRFDLDELIRRLDRRRGLPARRRSDDADRHATMDATIDWSYQLLDAAEQELLRHLSVFPASFDLAAVEASAPPSLAADADVLLGELVDKSLVVREPGAGRYRLLETIRAFARHHLQQAGEAPDAMERHRRHVRDRIGSTSRLDRWLSARLAAHYRTDLENARQAFAMSIADGHIGDAVEIAVGAAFLWRNAIGCSEGNAWIAKLLDQDLSDRDRLWVQILGADVGQGRGDSRQMFEAGEAAEHVASSLTEDDVAGACLAAHYGALEQLTDAGRAKTRLTPALELARSSGDGRLVTLVEAFVAVADIAAGEHEPAAGLLDALEASASEDGYDRFIVHWAGWMVGLAEMDAEAARHWMRRQQAFLDRTGIVETWITSFSTAMCEALEGGDVRGRLRRTLALAAREGYRADADCLLALAYAEICAGRSETAAELTAAAIQHRFNATAHYVLYRAVIDHALRRDLDPAAFGSAVERGRRLSASQALAAQGI